MKFNEKLNEYITAAGCTAKELSAVSGISPATLSRYRSGERVPEADSEQLMKLCAALAAPASSEADMPSEAEIRESFLACDDIKTTDKEQLRANFSALISAAGLNISKLCRQANYDVSTVFRFRSGERQPSDPEHFASDVAAFTARELDSEIGRAHV